MKELYEILSTQFNLKEQDTELYNNIINNNNHNNYDEIKNELNLFYYIITKADKLIYYNSILSILKSFIEYLYLTPKLNYSKINDFFEINYINFFKMLHNKVKEQSNNEKNYEYKKLYENHIILLEKILDIHKISKIEKLILFYRFLFAFISKYNLYVEYDNRKEEENYKINLKKGTITNSLLYIRREKEIKYTILYEKLFNYLKKQIIEIGEFIFYVDNLDNFGEVIYVNYDGKVYFFYYPENYYYYSTRGFYLETTNELYKKDENDENGNRKCILLDIDPNDDIMSLKVKYNKTFTHELKLVINDDNVSVFNNNVSVFNDDMEIEEFKEGV